MQSLIEIDGRIVATDILTEYFCCDPERCGGQCCVEGDSGAPLEDSEPELLKAEYESYSEYMTVEGREAVAAQGFHVVDPDGDLTTPLIGGAECAYSYRCGGITMCAVEKAFLEGRCGFRKPVSCHLYPIRVKTFGDGSEGLQYHRWEVCATARANGLKKRIRVFESLKDAIVRRFGQEFYDEMAAAADYLAAEQNY